MSGKSIIILNVTIGLLLIAGIVLLVLYIPCPSSSQYILFRYGLAVSVACLSAILLGNININYKGIITAGGSFAVFLITVKFTPTIIDSSSKCNNSFTYTVFITDTNSSRIPGLKGYLSLKIGDDYIDDSLTSKGLAEFKNIPSAYLGKTSVIELHIPGYLFGAPDSLTTKVTLKDSSYTLTIRGDNSLCCVSGSVSDNGKMLDSVTISVEGIPNKTFQPDHSGNFAITFPGERRESQVLIFERPGYSKQRVQVFPGTKQNISITLNPAK